MPLLAESTNAILVKWSSLYTVLQFYNVYSWCSPYHKNLMNILSKEEENVPQTTTSATLAEAEKTRSRDVFYLQNVYYQRTVSALLLERQLLMVASSTWKMKLNLRLHIACGF